MKPGDFIAIHTPDGTFIAKMISDDGDTITAEVGTVFRNQIFYGIPKDIVTPYFSVPEKSDDEEINKHPQNKERLQKIIMETYNVRPSTAYELTMMVERFAEIANKEYEYGKQDSNEE